MRLIPCFLSVALALAPAASFAQTPPPVVSSPVPAPVATEPSPSTAQQTPVPGAQAAPPQATPAPQPAAPIATPPETPPAPQPAAPVATPPAAPAAPTQPAQTTPPPASLSAPTSTARSTLVPGPGDPMDVQEVLLPAKPVAVLSGTTTWDDGFTTLKKTFQKIEDELKKAGIAPTGRPLTIFVHTDDAGFKFDAMVPIAQAPEGKTELTPEIKFGKTPEGKAFRFVHKDAYDEIEGTYETIAAYLDAKDIVAQDAFIEEYVTDLTSSSDATLEVNVYVQPK